MVPVSPQGLRSWRALLTIYKRRGYSWWGLPFAVSGASPGLRDSNINKTRIHQGSEHRSGSKMINSSVLQSPGQQTKLETPGAERLWNGSGVGDVTAHLWVVFSTLAPKQPR